MSSLRTKLMLAFILFVFVPLLVLGWGSYEVASNVMQTHLSQQTLQTLQAINMNISTTVDEMNSVSDYIASSPGVQQALRDARLNGTKAFSAEDQMQIQNSLNTVFYSNPNTYAVALYNMDGGLWDIGVMTPPSLHELMETNYMKAAVNSTRPIWVNPPDDRKLAGGAAGVLTQVRVVKDYVTYQTTGYMVLQFTNGTLQRILSELYNPQANQMMLVNRSGVVLSAKDAGLVGQDAGLPDMDQITSGGTGSFIGDWRGERVLISYQASELNSVLVSVVPWTMFREDTVYIRNAILVFVVLALGFAALFNLVYLKRITRFVGDMQQGMEKVQDGDLSVTMPMYGRDELGVLAAGFNHMTRQLQDVLNRVKLEQRRKQRAQFHALQAQINPHFLYNTLESINALALLNGQTKISQMTVNLGRLLRISINQKTVVRVSDEIGHVKSYLGIQKVRYADRFDYEIDVDEALLQYPIIKLVLQPLVENAIYHGFDAKSGTGHIRVRGCVSGQTGYFYVEDDGVGLSPDALAELGEQLRVSEHQDVKRHGLRNVHERLHLYYGPKYGVRVCSQAGMGTTIQIAFPLQKG